MMRRPTLVVLSILLGTSLFLCWKIFRSYDHGTVLQVLQEDAHENVSSVSLLIRMSGKREDHKIRFYCNMLKTVVLFWSPSLGKMVIVLDKEIDEDHKFGDQLSKQTREHFPSYTFEIGYEPYPKDGTILDFPRRLKPPNYNRQLWSSFLIDLYTNDDIVAWLDSDSPFVFPVTMPTIITDGKVRILGSSCTMSISWVKSWARTTEKAIGFPQVADFMTYFPVYIYRDTFIRCREYILKRFKTDNFEAAFKQFYHTGTGVISPVSVVISYAWYFEKDRYSWNLEICGDLNAYNKGLPEGHKIQPEHVKGVITLPQTAYHGPFNTVNFYAKSIPMTYCLLQVAAGRKVAMCEKHPPSDINYLLHLFNSDTHAHRRKNPHPCAGKNPAESTKSCLDILERYIEKIGAEIRTNLRRVEWQDFEKVDTFVREAGLTCPALPV
ncbi:Hypothetical predicted protein [Paramuricea clavata]|uniref:Uncharacterized protein n=1 Tax=Paramuricea clavata TaxID=317549 RepID=A0A7D9EB93_PARCT|nr:Hypothetical predicted protein [Paramuricea clavata]